MTIAQLICRAAEQYPEKTAVADRLGSYTFRQLYEAVRVIGADLAAAHPDGKPFPVGVLTDRSAETPVLLLAVAVSGGFYVPLNPELPAEKLLAQAQDAGLTQIFGAGEAADSLRAAGYAGAFLDPAGTVRLALERAAQEGEPRNEAEQNGAPCAGSLPALPEFADERPLYLIYTSGSTGKPKGVLKSRGSVMSFLAAYTARFDFCADDVIGNQTPFSFDASAKDLYLMLAVGATLQILPSELFAVPADLIDYLNERRVTVAQWVPTVLAIVSKLRVLELTKPKTLRMVLFVGETMPVKHLNRWRAALPNVRFVNLYGATELAGVCCAYEVTQTFADDETLPLGTALDNCRLYLVKDGAAVTEPGAAGELYLQSPALALEYYRDPERTAASFTQMDLGDGPARTFRTGDLARIDGTGALRFVSRADSQFKHLGYRIEAGEIETAATALPGVARCCCLYDEKKLRIVLFCELSGEAALSGREITEMLRAKLPYYMLPGRVNVTEALPLGANGKVDRQKLKAEL